MTPLVRRVACHAIETVSTPVRTAVVVMPIWQWWSMQPPEERNILVRFQRSVQPSGDVQVDGMEDTPRSDRGARLGVRVRLPPWILKCHEGSIPSAPMHRRQFGEGVRSCRASRQRVHEFRREQFHVVVRVEVSVAERLFAEGSCAAQRLNALVTRGFTRPGGESSPASSVSERHLRQKPHRKGHGLPTPVAEGSTPSCRAIHYMDGM